MLATGLGAVLCQDQGDKAGPNVIAYASRSLKPSEKHYRPYKLEFLALYWAVTKKFAGYLQGRKEFTVTTDHNPLTYLLASSKLDYTGHCWLADLTNFHVNIVYKPHKHNTDADALSWISSESVQAVCKSMSQEKWEGYAQCLTVSCSSAVLGTYVDWREEQEKDPMLKTVIQIIKEGVHVNARKESSHVFKVMRRRNSLKVEDGVLY